MPKLDLAKISDLELAQLQNKAFASLLETQQLLAMIKGQIKKRQDKLALEKLNEKKPSNLRRDNRQK